MQSLNSIERFLFTGEIYLFLEKSQEENSRIIQNKINPNIPSHFNLNNSKENEKEYISVPLKILGSILNLYFYSNTPKKAYDLMQINSSNENYEMGMLTRRNKNTNMSRLSSIQSNSIYVSESICIDNPDISGETQQLGKKSQKPKNLEDFILIKLAQSEIFLVDYNLDEASIEYKHKETGKNYKFKFKHCTLKEKNNIRIMVTIESYKYSIKNSLLLNTAEPMRKRNMSIRNKTLMSKRKNNSNKNNFEMTKSMNSDIMNTEFIIHFLDNLIMNKFKILIIDDNFFHEEQNLLKIFTNFFVEFKEMKLKINLYEEEEASFADDNVAGGEANNKETFASAFNDRFNLDSFENKPAPQGNLNENDLNSFKLLTIDASYTYMNDKGFNKVILPLMQRCPLLEKLYLNNNYLTDDLFNKLRELNNNFNIKIIDLSYNKIKGERLSSNLRLLITTFFELELINLKGNLIPTSFITKFSPVKFNNLINNIRKIINEGALVENKTKIKIDLRENLIDIEKIEDKYYLWESQIFDQYLAKKQKGANEDLEDDIENENESLNKNEEEHKNINENEVVFSNNLYNTNNFIFLFDYPYKGPNFLKEVNADNKKIKKNEFSIEIKKLVPKKNINVEYDTDLVKNSLDYYRQIFKFLFLIDYYFDPILNSFSHTYSAFIQKYKQPLSANNETNIFENQLKRYLMLDNNKIDLYKDSLRPKYKSIIKTLFTGTILYITKNINDKKKLEGAYIDEVDNGKIPSKYDYKEIPLYEAKEIYHSYKYYTERYESIFEMTKLLFELKEKDLKPETGILFNPNSYIHHLYFFYKFIIGLSNTDDNFYLLLSSYNKLISRIKIECHLAKKERDFYALKILSNMTYGLGLKPFDTKIRKKYELLKIQSRIIDEGLENLINFTEKEDVTLVNSYYDIFMTEANNMNYQSELTFIAEYIQFLRNNLIRKKIYEEKYDYQNSNAYITKVQNDFDDIYIKYTKISQILNNQIPDGINYKDICVHPSVLDYLKISLMDKDVLKKDLETITDYINAQNSNNINLNNNSNNDNNSNSVNNSIMSEYGIRNIFNRLTFLFMKNTKKEYPNKYGYSLSKKNRFLKLARLLFRFYNGLDGKNIYLKLASKNKDYKLDYEKDLIDFESSNLNPSLYNIVYCISNFNTNIKTPNIEIQRLNKEINSGIDVIDNIQRLKLEILKFSPKNQIYPLIDLKSELKNVTKEKRKIFQKISYKFYSKLLEISSSKSGKMIYYNRMYRKIKELIRFILNIKCTYGNNEINENFLMIIYKEIFYICLKYMNRENFNFTIWAYENDKNNNMKRLSFGILYILMFYLEFNLGLKIYIKEFLLDLYIHRYFPSYCKNSLHALNNNFRYDWVMSAFEIHNRIFFKNKMEIKIYFTYNYYEIYYIDEHTTVYDLFLDIFNNSKYFQDFKDKKLYWIYLVENDPLKDELLPDLIKDEYEVEINEIYNLKEEINKNNENTNVEKSNIKNIENSDAFHKNSLSINNSTIISNTNQNINTNISETKRTDNKYKIDDEYLQYLIDNKGFNKGMFSLHPDLDIANNNLYDTENTSDNNLYSNEEEAKSKHISNTNKDESESSSNTSESFSSDSNKTNKNKTNKNNKNAKENNTKLKQKKENLRESVYGSIVDAKEKELNYSKCMNRTIKRINLKSNEFVLEFLGNIEEKLHTNFADNLQAKLVKNNNGNEDEMSSEENGEEKSSNSNEKSEKEEGIKIKTVFESPNKILPDEAFKFDLIFNYFHFQICRRFYNNNFLNDNTLHQGDNIINNLSEQEQNNLFELISKYFTYDNRNNVVKYDMGKKLGILLVANMRLYNKEIMKSTKLAKYKNEHLYLYFFPKKILAHSAFKNIVSGLENLIYLRMKSATSQNDLQQEFIKSCMNYKEFYSSIYENVYIDIINNDIAKINELNEDLDKIHLKFANVCINYEGISILESKTYEKLMFFDYSDIVKIYLKSEYIIKINVYNESKKYPIELKINFIFNHDEESLNTSSRNRKKKGLKKSINYNEFDAYFLYEDIISFIQFNLLLSTQTKIVEKLEDFNFIYQKNNKYQNFADIKNLNEKDIKRFKISKLNNDFYNFYKKTKEKSKIGIKEEDKKEEETKEEPKFNGENILSQIMKNNPKFALMNEMREKENDYSKTNSIKTKKRANKSIFSSNSSINMNNNENDGDDFFSDVKVTNLNDNIEKKKEKAKQEKLDKMKKKNINIEELLKKFEEPDDIMKELEEEQKKWEAKVNSSISSFSVTSSMKSNADGKNDEYKINLYNYQNLNKKEQKHLIVEKKLETKLDEAKLLLKDRDLVSSRRKEELMKEREKNGELYISLNKDDKSMNESSYLSFLSKHQRYPF